MPKSKPDIQWDMGHLNIDWKPNPARIEWDIHTRALITANRHRGGYIHEAMAGH